MPSMKKIMASGLVLICGVGVGGGVAYGTTQVLGDEPAEHAEAAEEAIPMQFVKIERLLAPLVHPDGQLVGYVAFEFQLEVPTEDAPAVEARLPILLNGINMRTYKTPMASGPDGTLPELGSFRKVVEQASVEAFGEGVVREVAVTGAVPA